MQIEQSFVLPLAPEQAWPAFRDLELLIACLPGASLTGPASEGSVPMRFDVKLGPIAAGFVGTGRATFDDAARAGRFEGAAADPRTQSRVKGAAEFAMHASDAGSRVTVLVDYTLSGSLAQFGRAGIVKELAGALTAQFAENLAARLVATAPAPSPIAAPAAADPPPIDRGPAAAPLSVGSLLFRTLRSLLGRLARRLAWRGRSARP